MGLKNLQPEIQRHFLQQQCQLEEAFPAVTRSFSGGAGTRNCLFQGRAELGNIPGTTASAWFRSEWIQRLPYHSCLPCLTARGYHACSRDVSNTRAAHNWSLNYLSVQFKHSKLWSAALRRPQTHPPSCLLSSSNQALHPASEQSSRTRNLQEHWSQLCSKRAWGPHWGSEHRHPYFPGLTWRPLGRHGGWQEAGHLQQKSPAQSQASCWYCHGPY